MPQKTEEMEIDLFAMLRAVLRRAWLVILSMVVCGGIAFSYAFFFITPLYKSNVLFYVNNSSFSMGSTSFSISSSDLTAAKSLVSTYIVILKTRTTLNDVLDRTQLTYTYEELEKMIKAESVNNTEVFSVAVTSPDAAEAEFIANTIAVILPDKIADVVEGSSVRIVDYAIIPAKKDSPNVTKYTAIGLLLGAVLAVAAIVLMEMFDEYIRNEDYLIQNYGDIPLLAVIPDMTSQKSRGGYYGYGNYDRHSGSRIPASEGRTGARNGIAK